MSDFLRLITSDQSRQLDQRAQDEFGLSAEVLMESAGTLSAKNINSQFSEEPVVVLCGPGHNGGDGLVLARHLLSAGRTVHIFCTKKSSPLSELQKKKLTDKSAVIQNLENLDQIKKVLQICSQKKVVIVDALFGVGLCRNIEGFYLEVINYINSLKSMNSELNSFIVSLDTPSGLNVDIGQIMGGAVKADRTLSFSLAKPGFYLRKGPTYIGELKILSIGFPQSLLLEQACSHFLVTKNWVSSHLPERQEDDHKARQGHLLVLAGREGFWGAGELCALSAYRMGAGYVTWAYNTEEGSALYKSSLSDVLTQKISNQNLFEKKTAVAIGPGLGTGELTKKLLLQLKELGEIPVVVDADAFTVCVKEDLFPLPNSWVLTPHAGELGQLFALKGSDIDQDPCLYVRKASQKVGCPVLLKGFYSVLSDGKKCWIIPAGNSALAKAGTGDVLTGFIGALMARSLDTFSATVLSAFVHGLLAEQWVSEGRDKDCLMAQDLRDILPFVLQKLRK